MLEAKVSHPHLINNSELLSLLSFKYVEIKGDI